MKFRFLTIIFLFFIYSSVSAQTIYLCKTYTPSGDPIEAYNDWEMTNEGLNLYILFKNDRIIRGPLVYMFIDKYENGAYYPYDSKAIKISSGKTWLSYNYRFAVSRLGATPFPLNYTAGPGRLSGRPGI